MVQPKRIAVSTLQPPPGMNYVAYDVISAMSQPNGDVSNAIEQLRWKAHQLGADAVVGVQIAISTFYGNTTLTRTERVVLIGTPIKFESS